MLTIDDFVMLGKTVPEPNSDGRVMVCSAGISSQLRKLIRIYPLARKASPPRWSISRVPLELNPKDHRDESFKIVGNRQPGAHERINERFKTMGTVPHAARPKLLAPYAIGSIDEANHRRISLAILHPDGFDLHFDNNPASPDAPQLMLFEDDSERVTAGAKIFPFAPRLRFHDECRWWNLQLRDWGCYELMRKHPSDYYRQHMAGALHLDPDSSLLVGNMNNRRTVWLIISVLNGIRTAPSLFDALTSDRPRISEKLRRQIYDRDGWKCRKCGSAKNLRIDHVLPHSRGGITELSNLQTLCRDHNGSKGDQLETG
jgi:HNH endonuclease